MTTPILQHDSHWIYVTTPDLKENPEDLEGKYLFFSDSKMTLIEVAKNEIAYYGFAVAKISDKSISGDYVCCLYYQDNSRKIELRKRYESHPSVKFRGWKSNAATKAGIYSQKEEKSHKFDLLPLLPIR